MLGSGKCNRCQICVTGKDAEGCTSSRSLTTFKVSISIGNITAEYNLVEEMTGFLRAVKG